MYDEELTFKEFIGKRSVKVLTFIMILCMAINVCRYIRVGIYIDSDTFVSKRDGEYYRSGKYEVKIDKLRNSTKYYFTCKNMERNMSFYRDGDKVTATFSDGRKITGYYKDGEIVDEEGEIAYSANRDIYIEDESDINDFPIIDYDLAVFACKANEGYTERYGQGELYMAIIPIIVFLVGLFALYFPTKFHFFGDKWRYKNTELSEDGMAMEKLKGIGLILLGYATTFLICL